MAKVEIFDGKELSGPRLGQYVAIRRKATRTIRKVEYIIAIYGAYDAMGLIGSEKNGIVVLNNTRKAVVTDGIAGDPRGSGWYGTASNQVQTFNALVKLSPSAFLKYVRDSANFRGESNIG